MLVTFGIVFVALMLGSAIAFGPAFLEKRFVREKKEENQNNLSPLQYSSSFRKSGREDRARAHFCSG